MTISTLTFNMQNGQPWSEADPDATDVDLDGTIAFLNEQDADIVFLQEVECGNDGGHQIEPPPHYSRLRSALAGYDSAFSYPLKNEYELPFGLGLALFSKSKLRDVQRIDLQPADIEFEYGGIRRKPSHRLLQRATTVIAGREIVLLNTHLQAFFMIGATSDEQRGQRDAVESELRRCESPALLAGDFNCAPGEGLVGQFEACGFKTVQNTEITWRRMPCVLDHIFYNSGLKLVSHRVIPTITSDHHALRAEFTFA